MGALFALVASIALIAFATLTPGVASGADAAHWQFTAGSTPLTDACSNVLLFVPLGVALVLLGVRVPVAASVGVLLALAIEISQSTGHPVGRYATVADIIANGIGAVGGAMVASSKARWMQPNARDAQRLAYRWSAMVVVIVTLTAWLLSSLHRFSDDATLPTLSRLENAPSYPWFSGTVVRSAVSGVELVHRGTGPVLVAAPIAAREARVTVVGRDDRHAFVPLLYVHDARDTTPYILLGQFGDDAVLRSPRHGDAFGLRMPQLVVRGAFTTGAAATGVAAKIDGATRELAAAVTSAQLTVRALQEAQWQSAPSVDLREAQLDLTASLGWLIVQPVIGDDETSRTLGTIAWLLLLVAPALFWSGRSGERRVRTGIVVLSGILGVFLLTPIVFGVARLPLWQWSTLLAAATFGVLTSHWTNSADS